MALKKSELYSSLWHSCDALRGGMDASQYKDYVLVLLFIKYVSDKYAGKPYQPLSIPPGASFADMVALKSKSDIGDQINKKIIAPLVAANAQLSLSDFPDFNDAAKLGTGKEMVDRLTDLVAIFENKALDFSKNRADGDDILGDAYEYLMQHFATESGKSKGQFYTPAEVSRVIAAVLGIATAPTTHQTTVYDPTCGSGSLLLKVADAAPTKVALYGQEKDAATSGLARMNMILHDQPTAEIKQGNTLADPKFRDGKTGNESLKVFDYVVANPPFSDKRWSTGIDPLRDPWQRFEGFGMPPAKQGDYAYLLHIVRSLKSTGRAACILPHGVLFRGNAEADIRRALIRKGYLEAIIGLPANLFYGTGIPACIVVVDKSRAAERVAAGTGIFMVDASQTFIKDGPKNRLRERDIHRIIDTFQRRQDVPRYARQVSLRDIEKNEHNLNLPRYIDSKLPEDRHDIEGHLRGGIPEVDVTAADSLVSHYWAVCPQLERALFRPNRPGYVDLAVDMAAITSTIQGHPEFAGFIARMSAHFATWGDAQAQALKALRPNTPETQPRRVIDELSEGLLAHYLGQPLIDAYAVYQHLMDYWAQAMQDDCYAIAADGWKAQTYRVIETDKKGKPRDKGWACDLVPKPLIVARYFAKEQAALLVLQTELEGVIARLAELQEEHGGEDGAFAGFDKINVAAVKDRLREIEGEVKAEIKAAKGGKSGEALAAAGGDVEEPVAEELRILLDWLKLAAEESALKKRMKEADAALDAAAYAKYPELTETEVQMLVVDDKWLATLDAALHSEMDRLSQQLTVRVKELAERYEAPLPQLNERVVELEARVRRHLERMGFAWR
ncbi:SAM-dependent DNA methyltransferase [Achromobacter sp. Marseille-Q0513]|uniref:type I restriction-modification system subunit M n=1 Tax=Achromobacter sp. Marseille-Q0513 TaxID=2829161 RepID=UPI001B96D93A|nr:class I SAM-dependent DNA methyltransferase [Achromobacter sp. Marseille-Q0513]MBR8655303.1 SAM-dependent DNA methyltransferase [Achromobacter sp. Marseille-Q0513]